MIVILLLATRRNVMGSFKVRPRLQRWGWVATAAATAVMVVTVAAMFSTG